MTPGDFYKREVVTTADGSSSIYLPDFDERYHSSHGAVQESKHVFLKMGWSEFYHHDRRVDILEVGFGTGLNAFLVMNDLLDDQVPPPVRYTALEAFPVDSVMAERLGYWKFGVRSEKENRDLFLALHEAEWNTPVQIHPQFALEKVRVHVQDFSAEHTYDLIFFDAFAPRVQPELWAPEIFAQMFSLMNPGGILVTYCAKGEVRRNMIAAGFSVEKLPGPPGKREMLRAKKH